MLLQNITARQKLKAIELKYYQHAEWVPKVGDFYTIVRDDLKLFQIVREVDGEFIFACNEYEAEGSFPVVGFTDQGFGPNRIWVPDWIFMLNQPEEPRK